MFELATMTRLAAGLIAVLLAGCGQTSAIQTTTSSRSQFDGAAFAGETVELAKPTPGFEQYRLFQQGATGYVSLQSVRDDVEQRAIQFCDRKGRSMNALRETTSKPPHILGNFPRSELVFECVEKSGAPPPSTAAGEDVKFLKLSNLKKLLDNGTLTQAEFDREKAKILNQP
ncbi:SHOCT domain-containing protein [Variovorax sp. J22P240]|uniref:SHOCT domain-containing protein n=1 Tax=Variovorax sp. J22P240 TaxID=3053514 RepID=UPI0025749C9F|nr:SHOCT domain-containing protein [Variovorax sp. J22P240]MDL9997245.1 SHOCT domain-containing protein [Variovorax sp. J22P240]